MKMINILLIDDDINFLEVLKYTLEEEKYFVLTTNITSNIDELIKKNSINLIFLDIKMPQKNGFDILKEINQNFPEILVIMLTAYGEISLAVKAIKLGAWDFLTKSGDLDEIKIIAKKAVSHINLILENQNLKRKLYDNFNFEKIIGNSKEISDIKNIIKRVSNDDSNVLILGESGTGKELIAEAIHYNSNRKNCPFISVNLASIPDTLFESELFGHEKGSFTGAIDNRIGKFELANNGTIFLDEIGEIPYLVQSKLLYSVQNKLIQKIGGKNQLKLNFRIISATNKDLEIAIKEKEFREDLYYRLNVIPIKIPPLRERRDDIPLLIEHFLEKFDKDISFISDELFNYLINYNWPGNIRELENFINRIAIISKNQNLATLEDLPEYVKNNQIKKVNIDNFDFPEEGIDINEFEKKLIILALEKSNNNQTKAAKLLSISRQTLLYRASKYKIEL
jgi:two-component system NtrC family response regulator